MINRVLGAIVLDFLWFSASVLCQNISENVPKIEIPGHAYLIPFGRSVMLECHVTGPKPVKIRWTKHGIHLRNGQNYYTLRIQEERNRETLLLWIRQVWEADSGVYKCEAANRFGEAVDTFSVYGYNDNEIVNEKTDTDNHDVIHADFYTRGNGARSLKFSHSCFTCVLMVIASWSLHWLCNHLFLFSVITDFVNFI